MFQNGNNINIKSEKEIVNEFYNINEYHCKIKVVVYSNKNRNEYEIEQREKINENYSYQKIKNDGNLEEIEMELKNERLEIRNVSNGWEKIYNKNQTWQENYLFLSNFIKKELKVEMDNENIILIDENELIHKKKLYINKESGKIQKMEILDNEQKVKAIIEYIELEIL